MVRSNCTIERLESRLFLVPENVLQSSCYIADVSDQTQRKLKIYSTTYVVPGADPLRYCEVGPG